VVVVPARESISQVLPLRQAAWCGVLAAAVLLVNAAKRAELLPTTAWTQLLAPMAEILAIFFVIGLAVVTGMRGTFAVVATSLNVAALAALVAAEAVINLVFYDLPSEQVDVLRDGTLGAGLTIASLAFLIGTIGFSAACAAAPNRPPALALVGYAASGVVIALRAFVPEFVLLAGLIVLAASIAWLSVWLLVGTRRPTA
jgi:hypothetical protein